MKGVLRLLFDENKFKIIDNEEKAYWLGFLEADGYIHNGKTMTMVLN